MSDHGKGSDVWHLQRNLANANATIAAKDAEMARLREALTEYGQHRIGCRSKWRAKTGSSDIGPCDCGLDDAIAQKD